jgi:hypothetical protein
MCPSPEPSERCRALEAETKHEWLLVVLVVGYYHYFDAKLF